MGDENELGGGPMELVRRRLHKVSDMVQVHEGKLGEHGVLIGVLTQQVEALRSTTASREQLDHGLKLVAQKMDGIEESTTSKMGEIERSTAVKISAATELLTEKLGNMHKDLAPIRGALSWLAYLVIGAVVIGLLGLLFKAGT